MKELRRNYSKFSHQIKKRLKEFESVRHPQLFYELCFCILTPQSNAKKCHEAVCLLSERDFLNKDIDVQGILKPRTRFYRNKSGYLLLMRKDYERVKGLIGSAASNPMLLRDELAESVKGIGLKEASHFLRNIGFRDLAILDRHILKNLKKHGVIDDIPKPLSKKDYLEIEQKFREFSKRAGIAMDELDLLFWASETGEVFK